jgi:hypothetical protein
MEKGYRYVSKEDVVISKAMHTEHSKAAYVLGFISGKISAGATIDDIKKILTEKGYN